MLTRSAFYFRRRKLLESGNFKGGEKQEWKIKMHVRTVDMRKGARQRLGYCPKARYGSTCVKCGLFYQNQKAQKKYNVCGFHQITTKWLWSLNPAFISSRNNESTWNGIYILNYLEQLKITLHVRYTKLIANFEAPSKIYLTWCMIDESILGLIYLMVSSRGEASATEGWIQAAKFNGIPGRPIIIVIS